MYVCMIGHCFKKVHTLNALMRSFNRSKGFHCYIVLYRIQNYTPGSGILQYRWIYGKLLECMVHYIQMDMSHYMWALHTIIWVWHATDGYYTLQVGTTHYRWLW